MQPMQPMTHAFHTTHATNPITELTCVPKRLCYVQSSLHYPSSLYRSSSTPLATSYFSTQPVDSNTSATTLILDYNDQCTSISGDALLQISHGDASCHMLRLRLITNLAKIETTTLTSVIYLQTQIIIIIEV